MRTLFILLLCMLPLSGHAINWGDDNDNTSNLKAMVDRVKQKFEEIDDNPSMAETLEEAADAVKITIRENRPSGGFLGGCTRECADFRADMLDFVEDIASTMNSMRSLGEPVDQDPVNLDKLRRALELAPGPVLFPLSVAFNEGGVFAGITTRLRELPEAIDTAEEAFANRPSKCDRLLADREMSQKRIVRLAATGIALKLAGKALLAKGDTNIMAKKKVGIHGYAGVVVEDNKKKKVGRILEGVADSLSAMSAKTDRTFYQCEILAELESHDHEVQVQIAEHDADVKELLHEIIRLQLTPQGRRSSEIGGDFPLKPERGRRGRAKAE